MARRASARRVDARVTRLPGYDDPAPPIPTPEPPAETPPESESSPATPSVLPRRPYVSDGPTLEERQARWEKERRRFETRAT